MQAKTVCFSYGPDIVDIVRRSAPYVDKILRGAKPADLPIHVPVKFEMAVNAKRAKLLGLTIPPSILLRRRGPSQHVLKRANRIGSAT